MVMPEAGELVFEVPQTFTRRNWPFAVFLLFLGTVLATPAWLMGNFAIAVALFSIGFGTAFVAFLMDRASAMGRDTLLAVHERGLLVRRGAEKFVPWAEFERLERWTVIVEEIVDVQRTGMKAILQDGREVNLGRDPKIHDAVITLSKRTPIELGQKSSWLPT